MIADLARLPLRTAGGAMQAVVETPRGSRVKFAYDGQSGLFLAKKLLALGQVFPYPFGFLPSTRAEDGDPLDVMILTEADLPTATLVRIRLIGAIALEQNEDGRSVRNDRLLAVPVMDGDDDPVASLSALGGERRRELEAFFRHYQEVEGKAVRVIGSRDEAAAEELVRAAAA